MVPLRFFRFFFFIPVRPHRLSENLTSLVSLYSEQSVVMDTLRFIFNNCGKSFVGISSIVRNTSLSHALPATVHLVWEEDQMSM